MRDFASPPLAFAPLLGWRWTGAIQENLLARQVAAMAASGAGGVVVHPGHTSTAYLSDDWMKLVRAALRSARDERLAFWLGDDGDEPSGNCDGRLTRDRAALRAHYLRFRIEDIARQDAAAWSFPSVSGKLLYAVAAPLRIAENATTPRPDFNYSVTLTKEPLPLAPQTLARLAEKCESDLRVILFTQEVDAYIDLLNPEIAHRFLQDTHDRYAKALDLDFAGVTGFFARNTTLWTIDDASNEDTLGFPWSPLLMESFAGQPGYDLLEWLPALMAELGDDAPRLRQDFWATIGRMMQEGFWQPLRHWGNATGKSYAGYVQGQQPVNSQVKHQGDAVPIYRALTVPAVTSAPTGAAQSPLDLGRALHARLAVSVAALKGKPRVIGELTGEGWEATPAARLPIVHNLLRQGVNSFVFPAATSLHGECSTLQQVSERHQPFWPQWKNFADYITRQSYVMSHGKPGARVALFWPIRSAWAHYHPKGHRLTRWVEEDLYATALMLDDLHFEFLFLPEDDLVGATCRRELLLAGTARHPFELLVLPSVTALSRAAWSKIEEFIEGGGKVACLGLLPRWSEKGRDRDFETHISKSAMITIGDVYESYADLENSGAPAPTTVTYPMTRDNQAGGRLSCYQPRLNESVKDALLRVRKILKESIDPELETQSTNILYTRRVLDAEETLHIDDIITTPDTFEDLEPMPAAPLEAIEETPAWDQPFDWAQFDKELAGSKPPAAEKETSEPETITAGADETGTPDAASTESEAVTDESEAVTDESEAVTDESETEAEPENPLILEELAPIETPMAGGDIFLLYNAADETQEINVRLNPREDGTPYLLDAWTGEIQRIPVWMRFPAEEGGGLSLSLELAAQEARLIWLRPYPPGGQDGAHLERATFVVEDFDGRVATGHARESGIPRIAVRLHDTLNEKLVRREADAVEVPAPLLLPDSWQAARIGPNTLFPPDWEWQRGRHLSGEQRWFMREPWKSLPTRPQTARDMGTWERSTQIDFSGVVSFRTAFEIAEAPSALFLQFDPLDAPTNLYLNGEELEPIEAPYPTDNLWNDESWQWFDLSAAETGANTLSCVVDCRERGNIALAQRRAKVPAPARLVGDFSLTPDLALTPPEALHLTEGSWHQQGLPFYSGAVDYRQWVKAPHDWNRCRVFLEISRTSDVCGLWLNGRACGLRMTAPYRFDITRRILKGASNEVRLRLWNTAQAAMQGFADTPAPSGLLGPVRLVAYPIVHATTEAPHG